MQSVRLEVGVSNYSTGHERGKCKSQGVDVLVPQYFSRQPLLLKYRVLNITKMGAEENLSCRFTLLALCIYICSGLVIKAHPS